MRSLEEIRATIGQHHATFEYLDGKAAGRRYRAVYDQAVAHRTDEGGHAISVWRYSNPERTRWYVTIMGESETSIARATELLRPDGTRLPVPPSGMLEALRERRWRTALEGAAQGQRETLQEAHYGDETSGGARLDRRGRMHP